MSCIPVRLRFRCKPSGVFFIDQNASWSWSFLYWYNRGLAGRQARLREFIRDAELKPSKSSNTFTAVQTLDFALESGKMVEITGRSGSGNPRE